MNIEKATQQYESWLTAYTPLVLPDLAYKHEQMAVAPFPFLRATYYRWAQIWPEICRDLAANTPSVLSVGDLHVENFGTWLDSEGRLIWGVNDFDEACYLPYTNDLVRLATSARLAIEASHLQLESVAASASILEGYTAALSSGGKPFVLEEENIWLRDVAFSSLSAPGPFWGKIENLPDIKSTEVPETARVAIEHMLPQPPLSAPPYRHRLQYQIKHRVAGLGSLGHPRYVALTSWAGGYIAREAKALVPSAHVWAGTTRIRADSRRGSPKSVGGHGGGGALPGSGPAEVFYQAVIDRAVRCHDPFIALQGHWIVRRLSPTCSRIELASLKPEKAEARLLWAMGWETGNIHLGTGVDAVKTIQKDLKQRRSRSKKWLDVASVTMAHAIRNDWEQWRTTQNALPTSKTRKPRKK